MGWQDDPIAEDVHPDEPQFRDWYAKQVDFLASKGQRLDPDPYNPAHKYDYYRAYKAGVGPTKTEHSASEGTYRWPDFGKLPGHPTPPETAEQAALPGQNDPVVSEEANPNAVTPENYNRLAAARIEQMRLVGRFTGKKSDESEQLAVIDAYRQMAGLPTVSNVDAAKQAKTQRSEYHKFSDQALRQMHNIGTGLVGNVSPDTGVGLRQGSRAQYGEAPAETFAERTGEVLGGAWGSAIAALVPGAGSVLLGTSAAGNVRIDIRESGKEVSGLNEALAAVGTGLVETGTEYIGGKLAQAAGGLIRSSGPILKEAFKKGGSIGLRTAIKRLAPKILKFELSALGEGAEEVVAQIAQNWIAQKTWNKDQQITEGVGKSFEQGYLIQHVLGPFGAATAAQARNAAVKNAAPGSAPLASPEKQGVPRPDIRSIALAQSSGDPLADVFLQKSVADEVEQRQKDAEAEPRPDLGPERAAAEARLAEAARIEETERTKTADLIASEAEAAVTGKVALERVRDAQAEHQEALADRNRLGPTKETDARLDNAQTELRKAREELGRVAPEIVARSARAEFRRLRSETAEGMDLEPTPVQPEAPVPQTPVSTKTKAEIARLGLDLDEAFLPEGSRRGTMLAEDQYQSPPLDPKDADKFRADAKAKGWKIYARLEHNDGTVSIGITNRTVVETPVQPKAPKPDADDAVEVMRHGVRVGDVYRTEEGTGWTWTGNIGDAVPTRDMAILRLMKAAKAPIQPKAPAPNVIVRNEADIHHTPDGSGTTAPHATYDIADKQSPQAPHKNLHVRPSNVQSNKLRICAFQISTNLINAGRARTTTDAYMDELYNTKPGYSRPTDFWELPQWIGVAAHNLPNLDVYVVRDLAEARAFLANAGYGEIAFSALDVNSPLIQGLIEDYEGKVAIGGYTSMKPFKGRPGVAVYEEISDWIKAQGRTFSDGTDYRHFKGTKTQPRLQLSSGCRGKPCLFCVMPSLVVETSPEGIQQQVDSFGDLDYTLVYLNDKTFGQAKNYKDLVKLHQQILQQNPNFEGFIIQTTASQMTQFSPEFLRDSGIRYVELGIESYNDPILRALRKPASEAIMDKAVQKIRKNGLKLIPNVIVGIPATANIPGETAATYARTQKFLRDNLDVISHVNVNNIAAYEGTGLTKEIGVTKPGDVEQNVTARSFHTDPALHQAAYDEFTRIGMEALQGRSDLDLFTESLTKARLVGRLVKAEQHQARVGIAGAIKGKIAHLQQKGLSTEEAIRRSVPPGPLTNYVQRFPAIRDRLDRGGEKYFQAIADNPAFDGAPYKIRRTQEAFSKLIDGSYLQANEVGLLERQFHLSHPEIAKLAKVRASSGSKFWDTLEEILNIPRTLLTSGEVSGIARQGRLLMQRFPTLAPQFMAKYTTAFASQEVADAIHAAYLASPNLQDMLDAGLDITEMPVAGSDIHHREESKIAAPLLEKLPIIGRYLIRPSARSYTVALNWFRVTAMDRLIAAADLAGKPLSPDALRRLAADINDLSGRSTLPRGLARIAGFTNALFAPRFALSRVKLMGKMFYRPDVAAGMASLAATNLALMLLVKWMWPDDDDVEVNPDLRATDGGKVRIGSLRIDLWAGELQYVQFLYRQLSGERVQASGEVVPVDLGDELVQLFRGRLNPITGLIVDVVTGSTVIGEELGSAPKGRIGQTLDSAGVSRRLQGIGKETWNRIAPLTLQDAMDAFIDEGVPLGIIATLASAVGVGVQTYPERPSETRAKIRDTEAQRLFGKSWQELVPKVQDAITGQSSELRAIARQIKFESNATADTVFREVRQSSQRIVSGLTPGVAQALDEAQIRPTGINRYGTAGSFTLIRQREMERAASDLLNLHVPRWAGSPEWAKYSAEQKSLILAKLLTAINANARERVFRTMHQQTRRKQ